MTHDELCERAAIWLGSKHRCDPVFRCGASCDEIPDAIGWNSHHSFVVECKTSRSDFFADRWKYVGYRDPRFSFIYSVGMKRAEYRRSYELRGYEKVNLPRMGSFRFYLCEGDLLGIQDIDQMAPDHGLLSAVGHKIRIVKDAPQRIPEMVALRSETRYLRMKLIHLRSNLLEIGDSIDFDKATSFNGRGGIIRAKQPENVVRIA